LPRGVECFVAIGMESSCLCFRVFGACSCASCHCTHCLEIRGHFVTPTNLFSERMGSAQVPQIRPPLAGGSFQPSSSTTPLTPTSSAYFRDRTPTADFGKPYSPLGSGLASGFGSRPSSQRGRTGLNNSGLPNDRASSRSGSPRLSTGRDGGFIRSPQMSLMNDSGRNGSPRLATLNSSVRTGSPRLSALQDCGSAGIRPSSRSGSPRLPTQEISIALRVLNLAGEEVTAWDARPSTTFREVKEGLKARNIVEYPNAGILLYENTMYPDETALHQFCVGSVPLTLVRDSESKLTATMKEASSSGTQWTMHCSACSLDFEAVTGGSKPHGPCKYCGSW